MNNEIGSNSVKCNGSKSFKDMGMERLGFSSDNLSESKCITGEAPDFKKMYFDEICVYLQSHEQTLKICLAAVRKNGYALQYVKEQTLEICLTAVHENGNALQYVKEQTPKICMVAVKQDGNALEYVKKQTPEICITAVRKNNLALEYVSPEIKDEFALKYITECAYA